MSSRQSWRAAPIGLLVLAAMCDAVEAPPTVPVIPSPSTTEASAVPDPIAVSWLVAKARENAPRLAASDAQGERIAALARQAGRWDDPEVEVEAGRLQNSDGDERGRIAINQRVPIFGAKARARDAAAAMGPVVAAERRDIDLAVAGEVRLEAARFSTSSRRVRLAEASVELSRRVLKLVESQLGANQAQEMDRVRAQVDFAEAEAAVERARHDQAAALASLSRLVGVALPSGTTLAAESAPHQVELPAALAAAGKHPSIARATALAAAAEAEHAGARADGRPDITVGIFGERDGDGTELGVAAGVTVPIWNGNRHGIQASAAAVRIARAELAEQQRVVLAEAEQAWRAHDQAIRSERTVRERLLPAAAQALKLAEASYAAGGGDLAAVLDARRTLARLSMEAEDALAAVITSRIALDRAIATEMTP